MIDRDGLSAVVSISASDAQPAVRRANGQAEKCKVFAGSAMRVQSRCAAEPQEHGAGPRRP